jgi:GNAT superfamily N-acetyltransferase
MTTWQIRRATFADAEILSTIAQAAKRHWGYPEQWLQAWLPDLTFDADRIAALPVYVIESVDGIAGFYAMLPGAPRWALDHLWVRPDHMGHGLGRQLLANALAHARAGGAVGLDIEADPNAEPFYRRLGGHRVGDIAAPVPGAAERRLPLLVLDEIIP